MLIAIDLQNDYLHPKGRFYVAPSREIIVNMIERIEQAIENNEILAYTKNIYPKKEYEERPAEEIRWGEKLYGPFEELLRHGTLFEKQHYGISMEQGIRFKNKYKKYEHAFDEIEFIGVETNVCVLANMNIVQTIFTESAISISKHHTAAKDAILKQKALDVMKGLKIIVKE